MGIDRAVFYFAGGEVTVWDFAGQLEYTATHQLFVSAEVYSIETEVIYSQ